MNENGAPLQLEVTRTGGSSGAVTASCVVSGGTASAGDYSLSGALSWLAGQAGTKTCTLTPTNDGTPESPETVILGLGSITGGATTGSPAAHTVTINDDDAGNAGTLQFGTVTPISEGPGTKTAFVPVTRTGGTTGAVSVVCTLSGTSTASYAADFIMSETGLWASGRGGHEELPGNHPR